MTRQQFIMQVDGCQRALRRFLTALCCGDTQLADDIAQETFMKGYLNLDSIADPSKFKAWAFRTAYNTFINHTRSRKSSADIDEASAIASDNNTDDQFRYQALYDALAILPCKERTSVLLFYMQGYSIKEIAALENVTDDAVKQHLSRGRKHLRGILSQTND